MCSIIRKVWIGLWITTKISLKFKEIHLCCYLLKQKQCCASNYIEFTSTAEMYLSSTLSLVGFCLFPIISISFGLLAHSHEQNKTGTKDHELIVQLEQYLQNTSLELSFLRGEVDDLRKTNKGLVDEINSCNRSLETINSKVDTKYRHLTSLMHDLAITMDSMNTSLYRQVQQTSGEQI